MMKWVVVDKPKEFRGRRIIEVSGKLSIRLSKMDKRGWMGWMDRWRVRDCEALEVTYFKVFPRSID